VREVEQRLGTGDAKGRLEVLSELAALRPEDANQPVILRFDLPASDYELVLSKCLEGVSGRLDERGGMQLMGSAPIWIALIKRFKFDTYIPRIAALLGNENVFIQSFALTVLGGLDAHQYDKQIASFLSSGPDALEREAEATLLRWKSKELTPSLIRKLKDNSGPSRYYAIEKAGKLGDPATVPALLLCGTDRDENIRRAALMAVRDLVPVERRTEIVRPFARLIADSSTNREVVNYALAICVECDEEKAMQDVVARLTSPDEGDRMLMQIALEQFPVKPLVPAVSAALLAKGRYGDDNTDGQARVGLITLLRRAAVPEGIPALRSAMSERPRFVRVEAISALGALKAKEAIPELLAALEGDAASDAAVALAQLRDRRTLDRLRQYLTKKGAVDGNFLYALNQAYHPELAKRLQTTRLGESIEDLPDIVLTKLSSEFHVTIKVNIEAAEWSMAAQRGGKVAVYPNEDVANSIGRALYYINEKSDSKYCQILRGEEVHILRLNEAPRFLIEMFESDFR